MKTGAKKTPKHQQYQDWTLCGLQLYVSLRSLSRKLATTPQAQVGTEPSNTNWPSLFVGWLLNVPATCECISGTDLLRQFYVLPHWDTSCRPNFPSHPVTKLCTVYWHRANHIAPGVWQGNHWRSFVWLNPGKISAQAGFEPRIFRFREALTTRPRRRSTDQVSDYGSVSLCCRAAVSLCRRPV